MKKINLIKEIILVTILLISVTPFINAQSWVQIGSNNNGEFAGDQSGYSVSLNSEGTIVAIGAITNANNGSHSGHVRIFENILGSWSQIGLDIDGEATGDESGCSISLNSEGSIIAIGARLNDGIGNKAGHVRIYENISGSWTQIGNDIDGKSAGDMSGFSVSLNTDGSIVAIGSPVNDENGNKAGHVRVFKNQSGSWVQIGNDIEGEAAGDECGWSVCLNSDGSVVAIGSPLNNGSGNKSGHARIFQNLSGSWIQIGNDINGKAAGDESGNSVSLNSDGSIVAIGAHLNNGNGNKSGHTRIYHNVSDSWIQIGSDINGESTGDESGSSLSLNSDGSIVAIGANLNNGNGIMAGHVKIFEYISDTWVQIGNDIDGESAGDGSGYSVYLNSTGTLIAVGAPGNGGNGPNSGQASMFEYVLPAEVWTGTENTSWNTASNWVSGIVPDNSTNVTILSSPVNQPQINGSANCHDLTIENNATLTIKSDITGTGTLITTGTITNNGTINVERYFTGNDLDWHLVSSPVSDAQAMVFMDLYLQNFDETTENYTDVTDLETPINVMQGYGLYSNIAAANTVTFTGNLNTGSLNKNFTANNQGWNLMGNPYPSSIDWETVTIPEGMSNEVHYIRASDGNNLSYVKGIGGAGSQYIPPMQGFFIKASSEGFFTLENTNRTHLGSANYYQSDNILLLGLEASNDNFSDETWIHFNTNAGIEHDGVYDAYKRISSSNSNLPQIFSITPNHEYLSVNGIPETQTVAVGFTVANSGIFTIKAIKLMESTGIILEDLKTNEFCDLLTSSHTFTFLAAEAPERFIVHFYPLNIGEKTIDQINIHSFNKDVYVAVNENTVGDIYIYTITGHQVAHSRIYGIFNKLTLDYGGVFIVKVQCGQKPIIKKIFIK